MNANYHPRPADLSAVEIPGDLVPLVEAIAENVHDIWARGRMDAGWAYGPARDDAAKKNPCLVPYAELPESEKAYDRDTAIGTLKFILAKGWTIQRKG